MLEREREIKSDEKETAAAAQKKEDRERVLEEIKERWQTTGIQK
jgi:hypothetical protein